MSSCRYEGCSGFLPGTPDHRRLQLCAFHAAYGCLFLCNRCGESFPEHGSGGHGCATFLPVEESWEEWEERVSRQIQQSHERFMDNVCAQILRDFDNALPISLHPSSLRVP